jgi:copper chaperone/Cu+-exporting ATPase
MAQSTFLQFDVPDMKRPREVRSIVKALRELDPKAEVLADLDTKRLTIGAQIDAGRAAEAIEAAGFVVKAAS